MVVGSALVAGVRIGAEGVVVGMIGAEDRVVEIYLVEEDIPPLEEADLNIQPLAMTLAQNIILEDPKGIRVEEGVSTRTAIKGQEILILGEMNTDRQVIRLVKGLEAIPISNKPTAT